MSMHPPKELSPTKESSGEDWYDRGLKQQFLWDAPRTRVALVPPASIFALSTFATQHHTLRSLTIRTQSISDDCAEHLAKMMHSAHLEDLTILTMLISRVGARTLAEAIGRNIGLAHLFIGIVRGWSGLVQNAPSK